jgi:hypothetical protein
MMFIADSRRFPAWRCVLWLETIALAAIAPGCAKQAELARPTSNLSPSMGLFKVIDRECENPLDDPDNCPLIEYVELTQSTLPSLRQHPAVMIFWLGPQPALPDYTYEVWPLRGKFVSQDEYVLHDEGSVRDWLVLRGSEVREYALESFRTKQRRDIRLKSRLSLQKATRTPELDKLLRLEPE